MKWNGLHHSRRQFLMTVVTCLLGIGLLPNTVTGATQVSFDELTGMIGSQYAGVSFSPGYFAVQSNVSYPAQSSPNIAVTDEVTNEIRFANPVSIVGGYITTYTPLTVYAYDSNRVVIQQFPIPEGVQNYRFDLNALFPSIAMVRVLGTPTTGWWYLWALDDLFFERTTSGGSATTPTIDGLSRSQATPGDISLVLQGTGFQAGATVHVDYAPNRVVRHRVGSVTGRLEPGSDGRKLAARLYLRDPGEFLLTAENPNGRKSNGQVLLVGIGESKLPYRGGETWHLQQGNNSQPSHSGTLAYAYDSSGGETDCVVAMKAGRVHRAADRGMDQTTYLDWGNYITVAQEDGTFAHYAHLKKGTMLVRDGDPVQQGQALAYEGNSGYTLPLGRGHHIHTHNTGTSSNINAQTVPFLFEDVLSPEGSSPGRPIENAWHRSSNYSPLGSCEQSTGGSANWSGNVGQGRSWSHSFSVSGSPDRMNVFTRWNGSADLDLHLYGPSGQHIGFGGSSAGYSGYWTNPETIEVAKPESGTWRLEIYGWWVPVGPQTFEATATY